MNITDCPYRISELIFARLSETITPAQEHELDEWVAASEDNERLYRKVVDGRRLMSYLGEAARYDYREKFSLLEARIQRDKLRRIVRRWSVAAGVMIPLMVAVFFFGPRLLMTPGLLAGEAAQIEPGRARAQLTFADGSTVELGHDTASSVVLRADIIVEGDTLIYKDDMSDAAPEPQRITIPRGGEYFLRLSDGTGVWLNSETQLSYQTRFGPGERKVFLRGEAYFEVAHDPQRPFIVESDNHLVRVLGTSFAVRAYDDEPVVLTTLESGHVQIEAGDNRADLVPGKQSVVRDGRIEVREVDTSIYTAWYKGRFIFEDEPLSEILATLARWYDIDVKYAGTDIEKIRFTGELKRYSNIGELLSKLETLEKVRFTVKDRTVTVSPY